MVIVGHLSGEGMSQRSIAPALGVSQSTVRDDFEVNHDVSPDSPTPEPRKVTGLDGKTYSAPSPSEPSKRKRRPVVDTAEALLLHHLEAVSDPHYREQPDHW